MNVYAQGIKPPGPTLPDNPIAAIGGIISFAFQLLLIIAGLYAFLQIIFAGYGMIASGGDTKALEAARGKIIWAFVGLLVVVASWGLIVLVEYMLGVGLGFSQPFNLGIQ